MYMAELKGKLPSEQQRSEDILTSYFFGAMKNTAYDDFLFPWLESVGLKVEGRPEDITFSFWEMVRRHIKNKYVMNLDHEVELEAPITSEPDLIIRTDNSLILVEVKYLSDLGADSTQLEREILGGLEQAEREGRKFCFITLTYDYQEPKALAEIKEAIPPIENGYECYWTSWYKAYGLVEETVKKSIQENSWLIDLLDVMGKRGLEGFKGFKDLEARMADYQEAFKLFKEINKEVSEFMMKLDEVLAKEGFYPSTALKNTVVRDGSYRQLNIPEAWQTTYYARAYKKKDGALDPEDGLYFVKVQLDKQEPSVVLGYSILLDKTAARPFDYQDTNNFFLSMKDEGLALFTDIDDERLERYSKYSISGRLIFMETYTLHEFTEKESLTKIANAFIEARQALLVARELLP